MDGSVENRIVTEQIAQIKAVARFRMRGRRGTLFLAGLIGLLSVALPVVVIEEIMGLWSTLQQATEDMAEILFSVAGASTTGLTLAEVAAMGGSAQTALAEKLTEWSGTYAGELGFSFLSFIYVLLVLGPLALGFCAICTNIIHELPAQSDMALSGFNTFFRALHLCVSKYILLFLAVSLPVPPLSVLMFIVGLMFYYRNCMAGYLFRNDLEGGTAAAVIRSRILMQGNRARRFLLDLSFIGWALLFVFVLWIVSAVAMSLIGLDNEHLFFYTALVLCVVGSLMFSPLLGYRGVAAAEFYRLANLKNAKPAVKRLPGK